MRAVRSFYVPPYLVLSLYFMEEAPALEVQMVMVEVMISDDLLSRWS